MKIVYSLLLMATGAAIALTGQRYGGQIIHAVGDSFGGKTKCVCDELEDML